MSKSRLEKFLYALYSLDSSDLPKPLSRIEELYSCLVTGEEVPTFKPLSRVEKYLMTILGVYDVNELPNPISRVEDLLYKLAIGDYNLDDVKSFLSEHEELLAEIIRNGGVGGNIDIEYIFYTLSTEFNTLYNTAEKPVKSAVLKGRTLVNFEGMKSVENPIVTTTGKNLFDVSRLPQTVNIAPASTGYILTGYSCGTGMLVSEMFPNLIVEKKYVFSFQSSSSGTTNAQNSIGFYNTNTNELIFYRNNESFTLTNEMYYERRVVLYGVNGETTEFSNVQLEEGSVATEYESYKSTTITCNEDVELRDAGDVKDELDCFTGEVTKRVGEVVFDGSEDWVQSGMGDPTIFYTSLNDMAHNNNYLNSISCDKFVTYINESSLNDSTLLNGITGYFDNTDTYPNENWLYIKCTDSEGSVEKFKQWLSQNPVTVRYELITESVETVDISVVDQDGNNTKLKSFDDITYVTLYSEGAIPEAELEVATKNEEVLSTLSLEMDDISTAQTTLEETSNTQSENTDVTMFATTEIYEELL